MVVGALFVLLLALVLQPQFVKFPLLVGIVGVICYLLVDVFVLSAGDSTGSRFLAYAVPLVLILFGMRAALSRLGNVEVLRVVSPPVILIVSVLGSILGGGYQPDTCRQRWVLQAQLRCLQLVYPKEIGHLHALFYGPRLPSSLCC